MATLKRASTLQELIQLHGLSLRQLANHPKVGCDKSFISHLLAERRYSCSDALAAGIAEVLGVDTEVLFALDAAASTSRSGNHDGAAA